MIRLLIVHEHRLIGHSITTVLQKKQDIEVIGCVTNSEAAIVYLEQQLCDIVMANATLPNNGVLALAHFVADHGNTTKVMVTGLIQSQAVVLHYLEEGVKGYVYEDESMEMLVTKLHAFYAGAFPISPTIIAQLIKRLNQLKRLIATQESSQVQLRSSQVIALTKREREVLRLMGLGHSNQEIAALLAIEIGTAKHHVHKIFRKLGIRKREDIRFFSNLTEEQHHPC